MTINIDPAVHATSSTSVYTRRDRIARIILGACAAGAILATVATIGEVGDADGALKTAETWRLAGLPVFAGLFVILARTPRQIAGLWELVILNKLALVFAGVTYLSGVEGGSDFVYVDGVLAIFLVAAYVLTGGWKAWTAR